MKGRTSRRRSRPPQVRYFRCTECGAVNVATKIQGFTLRGHIKTMYCYRCRTDRDQEQFD